MKQDATHFWRSGYADKDSGYGELGPIELCRRSIRVTCSEDDVPTYASVLAFPAFFALIPFLVFVVALLGVLQIPGFFDWLLG